MIRWDEDDCSTSLLLRLPLNCLNRVNDMHDDDDDDASNRCIHSVMSADKWDEDTRQARP